MAGWLVAAALLVALGCVTVRLAGVKRAAREIEAGMEFALGTDTNAQISVSTGDRDLRALADALNRQLRALRRERLRLQNGDTELKNAVMNVSHDLRTPLTAIAGYLDFLEQEALSERARRYLAIVRERTDALTARTEELFRYLMLVSTADTLRLVPVDLRGAVEESLAGMYAALTEKGVMPAVSLPEAPVVRLLDRAAVRRVLENLLGNAAKYSGGDLAVSLTPAGELTFANSAPGLDTVAVERLFDRFYTVSAGRGASGLGLSIAKLLTERMGGSITARLESGQLVLRVCFAETKGTAEK